MARGGVTFSDVEEAARYLQGVGKNPTVDAIRERLGTGSRTTLADHLKRWKSMQGDSEGRLPEPLLALVTGLWDGLQSLATQRIDEYKLIAQQEITLLKSQLHNAQQAQDNLIVTLEQLQKKCDSQQQSHLALENDLRVAEKAHDKLNSAHQAACHQLDNAKLENKRLHQLATQIQANLAHYQQAIQQQQLEQNLAKEKQQALYAQEITQLKLSLEETQTRLNDYEKMLAAEQLQLQQAQNNYQVLNQRYENQMEKFQLTEHALIQLTAQTHFQQTQAERNEQALLTEKQIQQQLQCTIAVITEQLQVAQKAHSQAEDIIKTLRHEKLFLSQEKAQMEGALKQLQATKAHNIVAAPIEERQK